MNSTLHDGTRTIDSPFYRRGIWGDQEIFNQSNSLEYEQEDYVKIIQSLENKMIEVESWIGEWAGYYPRTQGWIEKDLRLVQRLRQIDQYIKRIQREFLPVGYPIQRRFKLVQYLTESQLEAVDANPYPISESQMDYLETLEKNGKI